MKSSVGTNLSAINPTQDFGKKGGGHVFDMGTSAVKFGISVSSNVLIIKVGKSSRNKVLSTSCCEKQMGLRRGTAY